MKTQVLIWTLLVGGSMIPARAQMMEPQMDAKPAASAPQHENDTEMQPAVDAAQQKAAKTFAKRPAHVARPAAKVTLTPLTQRERVAQLLDRFTFGPTPGQVDSVMAQGPGAWLDSQLNPDEIKDQVLDKRLGDYPTLNMTASQVKDVFPDFSMVYAVADGRVPYPADPRENAVFEVQAYKWALQKDLKKASGLTVVRADPTEAEKAAVKAKDRATASRVAGELFALPKGQRMAAFIKMPVQDRIAFTGDGNLPNDQRALLLADFSPRDRETFFAMSGQVSSAYQIQKELADGRILRDILTKRQLQAVMTDFWFNHFNVYVPKDGDQWFTTSYERDVIRKNALGSFHDLLLATAQSPAMLVYLDNWLSIGPDSLANGVDSSNPKEKRGGRGLNENYGREIMELHTLGVGGGYTQADVTALSAILTGWGVDRNYQGGGFLFDPRRHEPGPKTWLGYTIDENGNATKLSPGAKLQGAGFGPSKTAATADSVKQGLTAINILASSPQTAHFISYLLAQYFVADNPPAALVDRLQKTYMSSNGDIKTMLRAIVTSPEFNSRQYFHNKVKTPVEFVASAFRASATDPQNLPALVQTIRSMGMPMYNALPPTGYYLTAEQWMNSSALVDRLNFAYQLTNGKFANQKFDAPKLLALGLLTPSVAGNLPGYDLSAKPASGPGQPHLVGIAAPVRTVNTPAPPPAGAAVAMRVLEATMIGAPVSAQTNQLIGEQLQQQPTEATPADTLNLLTALVMGSPEFQMR